MNSCSFGLEVQAEATKLTILNDSNVPLKEVTWNATDFGDIEPNMSSTREITKWASSKVKFKINGRLYNIDDEFEGKEFRHFKYSFGDNTPVVNTENNRKYLLGNVYGKITMYNGSNITLRNVIWNATDFGDIEPKMASTKEISDLLPSEVIFEVSGKRYYTYDLFEDKVISFSDGTRIASVDDKTKYFSLGDL
jgi:hypothetical protein